MSHKILRLPQVINKTGISRSSIYAYIKEGKFPQPIKLSKRSVGWVDSDIEQWIDSIILKASMSAVENEQA